MNIAICDDNDVFCEQLRTYLTDYFKKYKIKDVSIHCFNSGEALIESTIIFNLAFLDVEMEGISGIHAGHILKTKNPKMIFFVITSYPQYLDEALHFKAFRYLTKPLDVNRLYMNLKHALHVFNTYDRKILIETADMSYKIAASDIIMFESVSHKTIVHTIEGEFTVKKPIKLWLCELDTLPFFQSHKSFIVNFAHVLRFNENLVFLTNSKKAYLTQRKYIDFKRAFMMFLDTTM